MYRSTLVWVASPCDTDHTTASGKVDRAFACASGHARDDAFSLAKRSNRARPAQRAVCPLGVPLFTLSCAAVIVLGFAAVAELLGALC